MSEILICFNSQNLQMNGYSYFNSIALNFFYVSNAFLTHIKVITY